MLTIERSYYAKPYHIPAVHPAAVRVLGAQQPYDFAAWPADAVILNLGTNDWNAFHNPPWGTRRQAAALSKP